MKWSLADIKGKHIAMSFYKEGETTTIEIIDGIITVERKRITNGVWRTFTLMRICLLPYTYITIDTDGVVRLYTSIDNVLYLSAVSH